MSQDAIPSAAEISAQADQVQAIADQVRPLLAGKAPHIQGAVLASLTATWVCGWTAQRLQTFRWQQEQTLKIIEGILTDRGEKL